MRKLCLVAATGLAVAIGPAQAAPTAADIAGAWTSPRGCYGSFMARPTDEAGAVYNVGDDGTVRVAQVQIRVDGDRLSIIDDRKIEYYRILDSDKVEYVGYDTRASAPAAAAHAGARLTCG
jgi:hypothetical protein